MKKHAKEATAVIIEPLLQCASGMKMYPPIYLKKLCEAAKAHDIHTIFDEIASGFGRTGTMFALEQAEVEPDFICVSKGLTSGYLPLAGVVTTDEIYSAFYDDYTSLKAFLHSHSFTGNPLACAVANETMKIFREDNVIETNWQKFSVMHEYINQKIYKSTARRRNQTFRLCLSHTAGQRCENKRVFRLEREDRIPDIQKVHNQRGLPSQSR